jgi:carboxyl-terminal processing protease
MSRMSHRLPKRLIAIALVASVALPTSAFAQSPTPTPSPSVQSEKTKRQLRTFNLFWGLVNDQYVYADFRGIDWKKAKEDTTRLIESNISDEVFYDELRALVDNFGDEHSRFLSPQEVIDENVREGATTEFGTGIIPTAMLGKPFLTVFAVMERSPASRAGIRAHDKILEIDSKPIQADWSWREQTAKIKPLFEGKRGESVKVVAQTQDQKPRTLTLKYADISQRRLVSPIRLRASRKRIGYLPIYSFDQNAVKVVRDDLQFWTRRKLDGLIVDVRQNGGGSIDALKDIIALFKEGKIGVENTRNNKDEMFAFGTAIKNSRTVPMVVLIDNESVSAAEVFAGVMQFQKRAKLIGQRSAGNIEGVHYHKLFDGSAIWLAQFRFELPDGSNWEGKGLAPDVEIDKGWDEYNAEDDPMMKAAYELLNK